MDKSLLKTFKILSIDGGGIKGLYSASILKRFEEKFNCLTSDHFDMICGTSTGGLIAMAVSLKIPAKDICDFYINNGPKIFPTRNKLMSFFRQTLFKGKFNDNGLKESLENIFGDKKIGDSNNLLCIPSYSITEHKPYVFKYDHTNLERDNNSTMVEIGLATSAAPTYFPLANLPSYNNTQFIDGGVWANNPALVGILEALNYFVGGPPKIYNCINILSLSSLSITSGNRPNLNRHRAFVNWRDELFETSMNGQSFFTDFFLQKISKFSEIDITYKRIPSSPISKNQEKIIKLDRATNDAFYLMQQLADNQALEWGKTDFIIDLFTTPKTYNLR
jgi:Patatin